MSRSVVDTMMRFNLAGLAGLAGSDVPADRTRLHATMLDLAEVADAAGIGELSVSEHHATANRSATSPLLLAAMALARTRSIPVSVSALLLPLHDPIDVAEQLATLGDAFPDRLRVTVALGYRPEEYAMYGQDFARRAALMDEGLEALLDAYPPARSMMAVGGESAAAACRAARHGLAFAPRNHLPDLAGTYRAACAEAGVDPVLRMPTARFVQVHVSDDPDASWRVAGPHYFDDVAVYSGWQTGGVASPVFSAATDPEELRAAAAVSILTPAEAIALGEDGSDLTLCLHPLAGGMPDDEARASVTAFCQRVLPSLDPRSPRPDGGRSRP